MIRNYVSSKLCDPKLNIDSNYFIQELLVPGFKRCMYLIRDAWYEVSEETIFNFWNKYDVLNCVLDKQLRNIMNIDMSDIVSQIDKK